MRSKKPLLKNWVVYAILDDGLFQAEKNLARKFRELLASDVDAVQLRFKDICDPARHRLAAGLVREGNKRGVTVIVNDRPESALVLGAAGVHLGKCDVPTRLARKLLGGKAIIGRSGGNAADAAEASAEGADYCAIGPVFRTPVKPGLRPRTAPEIRNAVRCSPIPLVAIGGINRDNAGWLAAQGVKTVAFIRYGTAGRNTRMDIKKLREIIVASGNKGCF